MIEKTEDGTLKITLATEGAISDVKPLFDTFRSQIRDTANVEFFVNTLDEIDTVCLQLLFSIKATLEEMKVHLSMWGRSEVLEESFRL